MPESTRHFQHYEVLRREDGSPWELGRGAMGITYKAFDVNLCCEVALKVVNSALLDRPNAKERFVREARAAAALRHRNVASVYHLGNDGEHFFYAMEFIDGETLDSLVRQRGPMPVALVLRVMLQVAKALAAAERQNLVHRDLKPSNLMAVHEDGDEEMTVKVIDFGLARSVAGVEGAAEVTIGGFVGTPQYASPEQLEERPLDARSDIYSLGVTAWYLLTSSPPFSGSLATVCEQQVRHPPPWDQLPASLPTETRELLRHALAKDPAQRPQNARELRTEIESALESLPEDAREETWGRSTRDSLPPDELVGGRYAVIRLLEEHPGSKVYLAHDQEADGDAVNIRTVPPSLSDDEQEFARLQDEVRLVQAAPHPNLVEIYTLGESRGDRPAVLVEEACHGFSLRDLLAAHDGKLPLDHVLRLLEQVAAAADHAAKCRLPHVDLALNHVAVAFPYLEWEPTNKTDRAVVALRTRPMAEWPTWTIKVHPLSLRRNSTELHTWAGDLTLLPESGASGFAKRQGKSASGGCLRDVATLAWQLLGGAPGTSSGSDHLRARSVALPALNEAANSVLQRALDDPPDFADCGQFYAALEFAAKASGSAGGYVAGSFTKQGFPPAAHPVQRSQGKTSVPGTTVASNFFAPELGGDATSAWDRLQIGGPPPVRPFRWLFAIVAIVAVFSLTFAGVLYFLLHGGKQNSRRSSAIPQVSRPPSSAASVPLARTEPTPPASPTPAPSPFREAVPTAMVPTPTPTVAKALPVLAPTATPPKLVVATPTASSAPTKTVTLHLYSQPRGAEVRWHGWMLGATPVDVHLPPGAQELVIRYPDGPETHQTINVRPEQEGTTTEILPMRSNLVPLNLAPTRENRNSPARQPFVPPPSEPSVSRPDTGVATPPRRRLDVPVRRPLPLEPFSRDHGTSADGDRAKQTDADSNDDD